jgi:hypothetical protein
MQKHGGRWAHGSQRRRHTFPQSCHTLIGHAVMRYLAEQLVTGKSANRNIVASHANIPREVSCYI